MESLISSISAKPPHLLPEDDANGVNQETDAGLAQWGSSGGFGMLAQNGVISGMEIPRVPDVSTALDASRVFVEGRGLSSSTDMRPCSTSLCLPDLCIPVAIHRFNVFKRSSKNQARTRYDDSRVPIPRWYYCQCGFTSECWKLHW